MAFAIKRPQEQADLDRQESARKRRIVQLLKPLEELSIGTSNGFSQQLGGESATSRGINEADVTMNPAHSSYWKDSHTIVVESLDSDDDEAEEQSSAGERITLLPEVEKRVMKIPRSLLDPAARHRDLGLPPNAYAWQAEPPVSNANSATASRISAPAFEDHGVTLDPDSDTEAMEIE